MSFMNVYMGYFIISAQSSERVVLALLNLAHVIIRQCSKKECARSVFSHAFLPINKFDFSKRWKGKEFAFQMVRQKFDNGFELECFWKKSKEIYFEYFSRPKFVQYIHFEFYNYIKWKLDCSIFSICIQWFFKASAFQVNQENNDTTLTLI